MAIPAEIKSTVERVATGAPRDQGSVGRADSGDGPVGVVGQAAQVDLPDEAETEKMSAEGCGARGKTLLNARWWQEAESWFFTALERGKEAGELDQQYKAATVPRRSCLQRGDFPSVLQPRRSLPARYWRPRAGSRALREDQGAPRNGRRRAWRPGRGECIANHLTRVSA